MSGGLGFRYREGEARRAVPHAETLARLAGALRISPGRLREVNRTDVLELLSEVRENQLTVSEHKARTVGYKALERQVLAVFSTDELREEIARRESEECS